MPTSCAGTVRGWPLVLLRIEGAALFASLSAAYGWSGHSWWLYAVLFFTPDVSMIGYLASARVGSLAYNAVHTTLGPILAGALGLVSGYALVPWLAVIWAAHIGFDRMLGYGLKYPTRFGDTHLGRLPRTTRQS
jgi:hypothetical protein